MNYTTSNTLAWADLAKYDKFFIGIDQLHKKLTLEDMTTGTSEYTKYPPYNIKRVSPNTYNLEMAVAGFTKDDIEVILEADKLSISGNLPASTTNTQGQVTYLWKGISDKSFKRQFTLADNVEIKNITLINGLLKITLESVIPESKKPKKLRINDVESDSKTQEELVSEFLAKTRTDK